MLPEITPWRPRFLNDKLRDPDIKPSSLDATKKHVVFTEEALLLDGLEEKSYRGFPWRLDCECMPARSNPRLARRVSSLEAHRTSTALQGRGL